MSVFPENISIPGIILLVCIFAIVSKRLSKYMFLILIFGKLIRGLKYRVLNLFSVIQDRNSA